MTYLLDSSTLISLLISDHEHYSVAVAWMKDKQIALCPITELAFLRIAVNTYGATVDNARRTLADFYESDEPEFIAADISALAGEKFPSAAKSTDWYLANLAQHHGMKWATLDSRAKHPAAELVA